MSAGLMKLLRRRFRQRAFSARALTWARPAFRQPLPFALRFLRAAPWPQAAAQPAGPGQRVLEEAAPPAAEAQPGRRAVSRLRPKEEARVAVPQAAVERPAPPRPGAEAPDGV